MPTTTGALSAGPTEVSRSRFEGRSTLHLHRAVWGHPEGPAGERDRARRPSFYVEMIPTQANRPEIICSVRDLAVPLNLVRTCPEKEEGKEKREREREEDEVAAAIQLHSAPCGQAHSAAV